MLKPSLVNVLLLAAMMAASARATTYYAKTAATGTGDCTSWQNACTLQTAIDKPPGLLGNDVWVKAGTYGPIAARSGVRLLGGFAGTETSRSQSNPTLNPTIIDGGGNATAVLLTSGGSAEFVLRGLTIRNGFASTSGLAGGGGVFALGTPLAAVNCRFENNNAFFWGGAVSVRNTTAEFVSCVFQDNGAEGKDGAFAGAGILIWNSNIGVTNCLFNGNRSGDGAAIAVHSGMATIANSTFVDNVATYNAGGAIHDQAANCVVYNSIFWGNSAAFEAPNIYNDPQFGVTAVSNSNVQDGWPGTGNINADPLFANPVAHNYLLTFSSPCRNTGTNGVLPVDTYDLDWDANWGELIPKDLGGCPRITTTTVDMGAYEYKATCPGGSE